MRASRQPDLPKQAGMTLIEVMAVVLIIGLASSLVILTVPSRKSPAQAAAEKLGYTLTQIQEEAIVVGRPVGLDVLDDGSVMVQVFEGGKWAFDREISPDRRGGVIVSRTDMETGLLEARPERETRRLGRVETVEGAPVLPLPGFVSDPTGISATASFIVEGGGEAFTIDVAENGEIHVRQR